MLTITPTSQKPYINRNTPGQKARRVGFGLTAKFLFKKAKKADRARIWSWFFPTRKSPEALREQADSITFEAIARLALGDKYPYINILRELKRHKKEAEAILQQ